METQADIPMTGTTDNDKSSNDSIVRDDHKSSSSNSNVNINGNENKSNSNENGSSGVNGDSIQDELKLQADAIKAIHEKITEIEYVLPDSDKILQKSIESLSNTLRNLVHNQQVLETKIEDLLKNQVNSDAAINDLSLELSKINKVLTESQGAYLSSHTSSVSTPRGPGRPPKRPSSILSNGEIRAKLPFGNVDISKSKKFFQDPQDTSFGRPIQMQQEVVHLPIKVQYPEEPKKRRGRPSKKKKWQQNQQQDAIPQDIKHDDSVSEVNERLPGSQPVKVSSSIDGKRSKSDGKAKSAAGRRKSQRPKRGPQQYDEQSDLSSSFGGASDDETQEEDDEEDITDDQKLSGGESDDSTSKKQKEIERRRDERERMLVTMKYSDRNATRNFMELNKDLFMAMKQEERKKRMTAVHFDVGVPLGKYNLSGNSPSQSPLIQSGFSLSQPTENSSGVNSPSSNPPDRVESDTLIADNTSQQNVETEEETNKQAQTPVQGDDLGDATGDVSSSQITTSMIAPNEIDMGNITIKRNTIEDQVSNSGKLSSSHGPRKLGIMSILNSDLGSSGRSDQELDNDHDIPTKESSENLSQHSYSEINKDDSTSLYESQDGQSTPFSATTLVSTHELPKKRRLLTNDDRRKMRKLIPMLPEKKDNRGRPSSNSQSQENAASLLMSSPVELYCRQGFFYKKGSVIPITAGQYLDLKFRYKEEELIKLTMNEEDYAELTRQDRINAYFLKPDVDIETAMACQVLSNVILTERYVNSLEYFLMEFRWENRLVSLGLKLRESKRTWQRRKALFALFEFWRDKSRDKRGFTNFTLLHAVKEMENYRVFINRSVSWFYNHITLLKMILFDLCDNTDTNWREWMFARNADLPIVGENNVDVQTINRQIDNMLTLDFLEDGSKNSNKKSSSIPFKQDEEGNPLMSLKVGDEEGEPADLSRLEDQGQHRDQEEDQDQHDFE